MTLSFILLTFLVLNAIVIYGIEDGSRSGIVTVNKNEDPLTTLNIAAPKNTEDVAEDFDSELSDVYEENEEGDQINQSNISDSVYALRTVILETLDRYSLLWLTSKISAAGYVRLVEALFSVLTTDLITMILPESGKNDQKLELVVDSNSQEPIKSAVMRKHQESLQLSTDREKINVASTTDTETQFLRRRI